jgi:DNA-binding response OmpR family regulator
MNRKILVVDDDKKIVELVSLYLRRDGYGVLAAYDGREALELARQKQPDLIVLDLLLPELDGKDVCRLLRAESRVPIIMLTARSTDEDKLAGLDLGADDYVTKPFNPRELVARIRAVLRRATPELERPEDMRFGDLLISFVRHEVLARGPSFDSWRRWRVSRAGRSAGMSYWTGRSGMTMRGSNARWMSIS